MRRWRGWSRPVSLVAWSVVVLLGVVSLLAPWLVPYDPVARVADGSLLPPFTDSHLLGSDIFGRDQLSRLLYGGRTLIAGSVFAVLTALAIGFPIGLVAGYFGGITDAVLMRCMDAMLSFPLILIAILLIAVLGPGLVNVVIAIAVSQVPIFARLVRALALSETAREYVLAARASGFSWLRIVAMEISPNIFGPVIVQATSLLAVAAGYSAALSYLGLGIQPPQPDWGYMVKEGQELLFVAPSLAVVPGLLITVFIAACNFVGDDLRDFLTPTEGGGR